jgi:hypothetical protein
LALGDFFRDAGSTVDKAEKFGRETIDKGSKFLDKVSKGSDFFNRQAKGFYDSFDYDDRKAVSGEAKALHPNSFAQFTPAKIIGVSRVPVHTAKGIRYIYNHRNTAVEAWKKLNSAKKNISNLKPSLKKPQIKGKNPFPLATAQLKKSPRVAGTATGIGLSAMFSQDMTQTTSSTDSGDWIPARKRKKQVQWI